MKSILIKDTTKEEREKIVAESLGCGSDCSMCCACGAMEIDYQQYIDGKKEIAQLNAEIRAACTACLCSYISFNPKSELKARQSQFKSASVYL